MAHTAKDKDKLILRIKRIRGQLNSAEKALEEEADCSDILHTLTACKGALGSLISEVLEGHIHTHILKPDKRPDKEQLDAAAQLIEVIKTYMK